MFLASFETGFVKKHLKVCVLNHSLSNTIFLVKMYEKLLNNRIFLTMDD